jgi:branched-chain amino acid transport system permease protein
VAGVLIAPVTFLSTKMGLIAINGFTAAVLGGFGSLPGAVAGGMLLGVIENLAPLYLPSGIRYSVPFLVMIGILVARPRGLIRRLERRKVNCARRPGPTAWPRRSGGPWWPPGNACFLRYLVFLATLVAVNAIVAIGLNLLSGYTNQLSFGHAGFLAIGAYTAAILTLRVAALPVPVTLLAAGVVTGLVGLALGIPCLRLEGLYLAMATLAFGFVVTEAITNLDALTRGNDGLHVPLARLGSWALDSDRARYYLALAVAAAMILAALNLAATRTGRAFLAIRTSEIAAQASGINPAAYKTVAFVLSAFYTGVAGGLFAFVVGFLSPDAFDVFLSVDFLVMIILGGLGSVWGSVAGAAIVTVLNDSLAGFQTYRPLIFGAIMIVCMLFAPGGLAALTRRQS